MPTYPRGNQRVYYRTRGWRSGIPVTARFYWPDLMPGPELPFTEIDDGLYYRDYEFDEEGSYLFVFYENAAKSASAVVRIVDDFRGYVQFVGD